MGEQRHMGHHFLIDEFVFLRDLSGAIEHQHLAEETMLEQDEVLMSGLHFIEHLVDLESHAKPEVVEQCLGDPAFGGRAVRRAFF